MTSGEQTQAERSRREVLAYRRSETAWKHDDSTISEGMMFRFHSKHA